MKHETLLFKILQCMSNLSLAFYYFLLIMLKINRQSTILFSLILKRFQFHYLKLAWIIFHYFISCGFFYSVVAVTDCTHRYHYSFISSYMMILSGTFSSLSFSSSPSLAITAGFGNRQALSPGQIFINPSTVATLFRLHCTISVFI